MENYLMENIFNAGEVLSLQENPIVGIVREVLITHQNIERVRAVEETKRTAIRESARVEIEKYRMDTDLKIEKYKLKHLNDMQLINCLHKCVDADNVELAKLLLDKIM